MEREQHNGQPPEGDPLSPYQDPTTQALYELMGTLRNERDTRAHEASALAIVGLDTSSPVQDELQQVTDDVMRAAIRRHAENLYSNDMSTRAAAVRFFTNLSRAQSSGETAPDPDQLFARQILSGEEAIACFVDILGTVSGPSGDAVRRINGLPPRTEPADPQEVQPPFTSYEQCPAAMVLSSCLSMAYVSIWQQQLVAAEVYLKPPPELRIQIIEGLLLSASFAGTSYEERYAVVDSVLNKMPALMRASFERQQQLNGVLWNQQDQQASLRGDIEGL